MKKMVYLLSSIFIVFSVVLPLSSQRTRHISAIAISRDDSKLAVGDYGGRLDILDRETNRILYTEVIEGGIERIVWNYSGDKIALGFNDNTVQIRETNTWQTLFTIPAHDEGVGITWSLDDNFIYTSYGGMDETRVLEVWDVNNGIKIQEYPNIGPIFSLQPQGNFAVSINVATVNLLNPQTMTSIATLSLANDFENNYQIDTLDWSPDGTQIAIGYKNGKIRIWDIQTYSIVRELELGNEDINLINLISYNANGTRLSTLTYLGLQVSWRTSNWDIIHEKSISNITLAEFNYNADELIYVSSGINLVLEILCDVVITENTTNEFVNSLITGNQLGYINICLTENATYTLTASLPDITGDITLIGNGVQIVMTGERQIFNITESGTLTLKNVTIVSENAEQAIFNAGELNLENVTFENREQGE